LAGALHEVSNALTVVLGWIDQARAGATPEALGALDVAAARARQARHIVRRAIGADVPDEPASKVEDLVHDSVTGLEPEAKRLGLRIQSAIDPGIEGALVEQGSSVVQILTNLLLNALAVSPPGVPVRVEAKPDGAGAVVLGVADDGPGISPERRPTLFAAGVSTRAGGAGIGLRHAAALARKAGGSLTLADGESGARFELRWPRLLAGAGRRSSSSSLVPMVLAGARILVVEDDDAVVDLLDTALTARGATVVSAKSPRALSEALVTGAFDAALIDISPISDDIEGALAAVRDASPSAKVIVISGSAGSGPALTEKSQAIWVRKPFEIREIVEALSR
jgi:CheY-like chemotaxis protein